MPHDIVRMTNQFFTLESADADIGIVGLTDDAGQVGFGNQHDTVRHSDLAVDNRQVAFHAVSPSSGLHHNCLRISAAERQVSGRT